MDILLQDARYALRALRRDFGFAAIVVLTLAIGIGVNTAVFSVVRSVLLQPLPYRDPERLVMLWTDVPAQGVHEATSSYANVLDWRAEGEVLQEVATFDPTSLTMTDGEWPEQIAAARASANLFPVLGVAPTLGRGFSREEEEEGAPVAVLSHALWTRRFAASPAAIGRSVEIGGRRFQVVGVMPESFGFPDAGTLLWVPQSSAPDWAATRAQRGTGPWRVVARLRADVPLARAREELGGVAARLARAHPGPNAGLGVSLVPLRDEVTGGSFRLALWTLFGAVGLVLLMACANGAHMILARGMNRSQEFALRASLGATTSRLIRQALTESMLLAALAGLVGVLLATAGLRLLVSLAPGYIPRLDEVTLDPVVLAYATAVSLGVGLLFGVAPALGFSTGPLSDALRQGRSPSLRTRGHRARRLLIVFQFTLAIVLVFGASLLIRSFLQLRGVDPGFRSEDVLMANLSVEAEGRRLPFYEQLVQEVRSIPGVEASGIVEELFLSGAPNRAITLEGAEAAEPIVTPLRIDAVAGDLFRTLGVPLRAGRGFSPADGPASVPVALVNETMARRFWPGESPIGKRVRPGGPESGAPWLEIVGVVGDMRRQGPETAPIPQLFRPYAQEPSRNMILLIRAREPAPGLVPAVRSRIAALDRSVPLYRITTVQAALDGYLLQRRFQTFLLGLFSAIALALAAFGIYGLIQYSVSQRTREIGVRLALGGTAGQVVSMILRQGLTAALQGLAVGMVCALLLSRALSALFYGVAASDPANIAVTAGILLLTTLAACYLPARRAARVDPMTALRHR